MTNSDLTYDDFLDIARADPAVLALVLIGSHAHEGLATHHSDHDLWVVLDDDAATDLTDFSGHRTAELDLVVVRLAEFKAAGMPGFMRYGLARGKVVLDRLGGGVAEILAAKARLGEAEAFTAAGEWLDSYANSLYRSVKNARDGHRLASRLDAAESMGYLLETLFALDRRPRPYNKYLEWELRHEPLPGWNTEHLLATIGHITATGSVEAQRALFAEVEARARRVGHGATLDAWGDDLKLMKEGHKGELTA
jgi:hypothetical protein